MRFIDEAIIRVNAGHGGPGCVSFRREKFIPRGGPDGGDGGDGGNVIFKANVQLGTLQDFRFRRVYDAPAGMHGSGANKAGRDGEDIIIQVPIGTVLKDAETGELLIDFTTDGEEWVACKGGRGGKGNAHFVSSTFQAPKFAQSGEVGQFRELKLELKLLADAAIIGFPNAGKSTLISRISAARPKIADYAFTTLTPNLGVVSLPDHISFVVADTPGLIEGAHKGHGLGHRFLKHIERNRIFIHLLDGTRLLEDVTKPEADGFDEAIEELTRRYATIRTELELYNPELLKKPELVVLNKVDLLESEPELVKRAKIALHKKIGEIRGIPPLPEEPFITSTVSGRGIDPVLHAVYAEIKRARELEARSPDEPEDRLPDDDDIRK